MAMRVEFTRSAEREFRKLPKDAQAKFAAAIPSLSANPRRARAGLDVRRLRGAANVWRLRVGDWRAIYAIEGSRIVFTRFAHRSRVYETWVRARLGGPRAAPAFARPARPIRSTRGPRR